jgi:hypothetical protein
VLDAELTSTNTTEAALKGKFDEIAQWKKKSCHNPLPLKTERGMQK